MTQTTDTQHLNALLALSPFALTYHYDIAELLIAEESETAEDIFKMLKQKIEENNSTIYIQTYNKRLLCELDEEIFELYPINRYEREAWFKLLKYANTQYQCKINEFNPYSGGIIDTYEGISFKIETAIPSPREKKVLPQHISDMEQLRNKEEREKRELEQQRKAFKIIEERSDYLYFEYKKEKYEAKLLLGFFELTKNKKYLYKGLTKDSLYQYLIKE